MRIVLASLIAAVAMFVWGFVSWTVLGLVEMKQFENDAAAQETLRAAAPESGVYVVPSPPKDGDLESSAGKRFLEMHKKGPLAMVVVQVEGTDPMDPITFAKGFGILFLTALVLAALLTRLPTKDYLARVLFVTGIGLVATLQADGADWAWFRFPNDWFLMAGVDRVITFAVGGLVLAGMVKPR
ncbi:MAG: hypothetical protein AAGD14_05960 [Planctomycetota bacterium]